MEHPVSEDDEVTKARLAIGLPRDRFFQMATWGGVGPGVSIVCKCIHCGTLFGSHSHDLADLDHINKGDCGRPWMHDLPKPHRS
jgi:hypothetical protein